MNEIPTCREVERDLVAVAAGEAGPTAAQGVERHVAICGACRDELGRYRVLEGMVSDLRRAPMPGADPTLARAELESRLADIRSRMGTYGIYTSPLGAGCLDGQIYRLRRFGEIASGASCRRRSGGRQGGNRARVP